MRHAFQLATIVIAVAYSVAAQAQQQQQESWQWARNLDEARAQAAATNRLVLVHFYDNPSACPPCARLEQEVFSQPGFGRELVAEMVGVKVNVSLYPATARAFGVEAWPTDVILTPEGKVVETFISPRGRAGYTAKMLQVAASHRHQNAVESSPYQRPVVSYGKVRSTAPPVQTAAATMPNAPQNPAIEPPPAAGPATYAMPGAAKRDRYADYYDKRRVDGGTQAVAAPTDQDSYANYQAPAQEVAPQTPPGDRYANYQPSPQAPAQPQVDHYANYQQPSAAVATGMQVGPATPAAAPATVAKGSGITQDQLPAGAAPLAMDGYCPVTLMEQQRWVRGDVKFGVTHEGRTYLFTSAQELEKFWRQPHYYSPVMAGNDPVIATDNGQLLPGSREHGLFVNGRIYLFVSEETLGQFERNRDRYVQSVSRTLR